MKFAAWLRDGLAPKDLYPSAWEDAHAAVGSSADGHPAAPQGDSTLQAAQMVKDMKAAGDRVKRVPAKRGAPIRRPVEKWFTDVTIPEPNRLR